MSFGITKNHGLNAGGSYNTIGDTYYIDWIIDNNSDNSSTGLKFTSKYRDYYAGSPYPLTTNDVMFLRYDGNVGQTTSPLKLNWTLVEPLLLIQL